MAHDDMRGRIMGMWAGEDTGHAGTLVPAAVALAVSAAARTASPGQPASPGSPAQQSAAGSPPAACTGTEIRTAVARFFERWNQRNPAAFGRLFDSYGGPDMATKHQNTLAGHQAWVSSGGPGAITAFAARQWRLGEKLSYRGISVLTGGGSAANGAYPGHVAATLGDGTSQPMTEAKFVYDCAGHAIAHVVIISARAAQST
jgi:hypothetical protein